MKANGFANQSTYNPSTYFNMAHQFDCYSNMGVQFPAGISQHYMPLAQKPSGVNASHSSHNFRLAGHFTTESSSSSSSSLSSSSSATSVQQTMRRTRVGQVSKTRASKRPSAEVNLHKTCPGCMKLWRMCNCSNVKNRPAPKPYAKFIPPRMLRKQSQLVKQTQLL